jgi:hypothetical protein
MFVGNVVASLDGGGAAGKIPEPDAAVDAARNAIVEPVIEQIKQARGFRQFLLGGFKRCKGMVAGGHTAQHSKAVPPVRMMGTPTRQSWRNMAGTSRVRGC